MRTIRILIGSLILLVMTLPACSDDDEPQEGLPNPASVFCKDRGGTIDVREDAEGNQYGVCVFPDGSECGEWDFYHGDCSPGGGVGLPNPASAYCEENGGTVDVREDAEGNQYGVCVFPDGSECDEWAFYRDECSPGAPDESPPAPAPGMANPASEFCIDQGGRLEIRQEAGGEAGYCIGPNGVECPEWALFNGECAWGDAGE